MLLTQQGREAAWLGAHVGLAGLRLTPSVPGSNMGISLRPADSVPVTHPSVPLPGDRCSYDAWRGSGGGCEGTTAFTLCATPCDGQQPGPLPSRGPGFLHGHVMDMGVWSLNRGNRHQGRACACVCGGPCPPCPACAGGPGATGVSEPAWLPWALAACPASCLTMDTLSSPPIREWNTHLLPKRVSAGPPSTAVCPATTGPGSHRGQDVLPHPPLPPAGDCGHWAQ